MNDTEMSPGREGVSARDDGRMSLASRILVADDEPAIVQISSSALARAGYQVDTATDGAAAWEALHAGRYHLLITDHAMPKLSGFELLERIHAARMALPVIMATGTAPEEALARAPWLKPVATLLKPYTAAELLVKVRAILTTHGAVEDVAPQPAPGGLGVEITWPEGLIEEVTIQHAANHPGS